MIQRLLLVVMPALPLTVMATNVASSSDDNATRRLGASYRVTFASSWSSSTHPVGFPGNPHFSGLIGGTHSAAVSFWNVGQLASPGIESMAETGSKTLLSGELQSAINAGHAEHILSGGGISLSPGQVVLEFEISEAHSLVTLVSMLAPSPDWFVGVAGLDLFEGGSWAQRVEVPLVVYDSGTDSGSNYTSPNSNTDPPVDIAALTVSPFDTAQQVGTLVFELQTSVGVDADDVRGAIRFAELFPNPTNGPLVVEIDNAGAGDVDVQIFDLLGRRLEDAAVILRGDSGSRRHALDLGDYPAGLYVIRLSSGSWSESRTVVVAGR